MSAQKFKSRVRVGAIVLGLAIFVELIRYTITSFQRALRFCFWEPERWNAHWLVDEGTVIETGLRIGYFTIWAVVILASILVFLAALKLLYHFSKGEIFGPEAARWIMWVGGLLVLALAIDTVFMFADVRIITSQNETPLPLAFVYDPSDLKAMCLGAVLFLFGSILREATRIDTENREFV